MKVLKLYFGFDSLLNLKNGFKSSFITKDSKAIHTIFTTKELKLNEVFFN